MKSTVRVIVEVRHGNYQRLATATKAFEFPFTPRGNCLASAKPFKRLKLGSVAVHDFDRGEVTVEGTYKIELENAARDYSTILKHALAVLKDAVRLQWAVEQIDDQDLLDRFNEATREA